MSDQPNDIHLGHAYVRPLGTEGPTDWIDLGLTEGITFGRTVPTRVPGISTDPLDRDRHRSGLPGDERCGAMGVRERTVGSRTSRIATPCWLRPNHDGNVHEGAAGTWAEPEDPRGVKTVRPERTEEPD
jgi:hypothetical protein